jgi:solute carrier family 30 (zinc transporter), member 9
MSEKKSHGFISVLVALICNVFITAIKFIGWFLSGSGAMFSEAIHSVADATNQALLMVGIQRSQKKADDNHNYGYGQERYFWSLVSACGVFFVGCGVTVYHGVHSIFLKDHPEITLITFAILSVSLVLEAVSFRTALKEIKEASHMPIMRAIRSGDPTTLAVLLEDGVALVGIILAMISIGLTKITGMYYWDSAGSILIGLMLGAVAIILANLNRKYLIEVAMPDEYEDKLKEILLSTGKISSIYGLRSSVLNIGEYRVRIKIVFNNSCFKNVNALEPSEIIRQIGQEIAALKKVAQEQMPCIRFLTIEVGTPL